MNRRKVVDVISDSKEQSLTFLEHLSLAVNRFLHVTNQFEVSCCKLDEIVVHVDGLSQPAKQAPVIFVVVHGQSGLWRHFILGLSQPLYLTRGFFLQIEGGVREVETLPALPFSAAFNHLQIYRAALLVVALRPLEPRPLQIR